MLYCEYPARFQLLIPLASSLAHNFFRHFRALQSRVV
jgi:hypothetical protein